MNVLPADGASGLLHRAAHAHFLLDAALDLSNQVLVALGPQHIGVALQVTQSVPRRREDALIPHQFGAVDAGGLSGGAPLVVENTALTHKEGGQLLQSLRREPLPVPIHLIVAQPHGEGVYLLLCQLFAAHGVDEPQFSLIQGGTLIHPGLLVDVHTVSPFSLASLSISTVLACWR